MDVGTPCEDVHMSADPAATTLDEREFEELLWAERFATAESWGEEPGAVDDLPAESIGATPAVRRFLDAQLHREALLAEWEQAATEVARWQAVQTRVLAESL